MVKDFCECLRKAYTMSGKDCDTCSWGYLPEHIWEPLKLIRRLLDIVGLELIGITVRDRKSKRKYSWGGDTVGKENC